MQAGSLHHTGTHLPSYELVLRVCGTNAGGVQPGNGQLQLGTGVGVLQCHAPRRRAAQHTFLQRSAFTRTDFSIVQIPADHCFHLHSLNKLFVCANNLFEIVLFPCCVQLIAACERDGEADRALEAFARMEREAGSECLHPVLS